MALPELLIDVFLLNDKIDTTNHFSGSLVVGLFQFQALSLRFEPRFTYHLSRFVICYLLSFWSVVVNASTSVHKPRIFLVINLFFLSTQRLILFMEETVQQFVNKQQPLTTLIHWVTGDFLNSTVSYRICISRISQYNCWLLELLILS